MSNQYRQPKASRSRNRSSRPRALTRRTFVRGMVIASVAAQLPTVSALATVGEPAMVALNQDGAVLRAVLNRVIPACGAMPGAGEISVARFLADVAAANAGVQAQVRRVAGLCRRGDGTARSDSAIDRVLQRLECEQPEDFDLFVQAVYSGYYTDPRVLAALEHHQTEHGS